MPKKRENCELYYNYYYCRPANEQYNFVTEAASEMYQHTNWSFLLLASAVISSTADLVWLKSTLWRFLLKYV